MENSCSTVSVFNLANNLRASRGFTPLEGPHLSIQLCHATHPLPPFNINVYAACLKLDTLSVQDFPTQK